MTKEKRIPLNELLFGAPFDPTVEPTTPLADVFSAWYSGCQARLLHDQLSKRPSSAPPGEPGKES
jgi:hypothetical protein